MKKARQFKMLLIAAIMTGSSTAFAQVKIGTNPTQIEGTSNLEVEASTGSRKVKVDKTTGQLTIKDGTEGGGKILTSDVNGGASWNAPTSQNADVILRVTGAQQNVGIGPIQIDFNSANFDKGANFNLTTNKLLVPTTGYYYIALSVTTGTSTSTGQVGYVRRNGILYKYMFNAQIAGNEGYTDTGSAVMKLNAGDEIDFVAYAVQNVTYWLTPQVEIFKISN